MDDTVDPECLRRIKTLHSVLYKSKYFPFPCIETFSCLSFKKFHPILRPLAFGNMLFCTKLKLMEANVESKQSHEKFREDKSKVRK